MKDRWGPVKHELVAWNLITCYDVKNSDLASFKIHAASKLASLELSSSFSDSELEELHQSQNSPTIFPVSAVFGGLMGQEVIKSLSRKGDCANNILYFDGEKAGTVRYPPIPK
ncbi:hypothetical protein TL16_g05140 [Triparma laevis f. inornata]|uniref:Uncharacterized protein n=1 Tax=Triparma laevis f. inornata TaxID=1714386 RepID=A0A9W7EAV9_9STRA|nr:hypothetical protein TL16_g05140 [Triparma laevis f. inornata]